MIRQVKKIAVSGLLLFGVIGLYAQQMHEFSVTGGTGLSALSYKVAIGEQTKDFGGHFGLGYHFLFTPNWGVGTGLEFGLYNATFKLTTDHKEVHNVIDPDSGDEFEFRTLFKSYKEKQNAMTLQIPVMLQFQVGDEQQFYVAVGGKIGFPVNGKYKSTSTIKNSGYYEKENCEYSEGWEFRGFGTFAREVKGDLNFKTAFFLSFELGMKWKLNEALSLYTGAYMDYGLSGTFVKEQNAPFLVEYNTNNPPNFLRNSLL